MTIEFLYFDGCPHAEPARRLLRRCMAQLGIDARVAEIEGDHPSPSIRIDRVNVMGEPVAVRKSVPARSSDGGTIAGRAS
jgi:hypothetical protein